MGTPSRSLSGMVNKAVTQRLEAPRPPTEPQFKVLQTRYAPAQLPLFQGRRGLR